jgi:vancomycin resistance protein YoaR
MQPTGNSSGSGHPGTPDDLAPRVERPTRRRWTRRVAWIISVPIALVVLLVIAWAADSALAGDNVARNTELAGVPVGGMNATELDAVVEDLAAELPDTEVVIDANDLDLESTAGDLGVSIDVEATTTATTDAGTTASLWQRPFEWAGSFFTPRAAPVELAVDDQQMEVAIAALEGDNRVAPVEPTMTVTDGVAELVAGTDGVRTDTSAVREALPVSLEDVNTPIRIEVERTVVEPSTPDEAIAPIVEQANAVAQSTTTVTAGEQSFELSGADIVHGAQLDTASGEIRLTISDDVVGQQILEQQRAYKNPTGVTFKAGGGGLVPVAGHDAEVCCGEGATQMIVDALVAGTPEVEVPTRTMTAAEGVEWASTLGVNQVVSTFTTPHKCCQGRVTNIHTISDRIRGTLIAPGETFSVNELTGKRTSDKGYVPAPAIIDGEHVDDVGGGVSQFATTAFNAAFFAGLPIPEYKMHSEYISRYPYAREATLFYPGVDLKIRNDTPYGVVIWPTYTDTSVTVQLWSTPYARGEQTGQSKTSGCGSVTTTRTITYPDRDTETDTFRANYRCT